MKFDLARLQGVFRIKIKNKFISKRLTVSINNTKPKNKKTAIKFNLAY